MSRRPSLHFVSLCIVGATFVAALACKGEDGDTGPPGRPGEPAGTEDELAQGETPPGLTVTVTSLAGGTASGGNFRAGDRIRVNYRLVKTDGSDWDITELGSGRALVSGPTFNYQRVIAEVTDLLTGSIKNADGSYSYTFAAAIPPTYLAPINDSPAFGPDDGELTGQPLLEGTYTVGLTFSWDFTVDGEDERDAGNAVVNFLIGNTGTLEPREAVKIENCNRCHEQLRVHGGRREEATTCVLCHTSGAESGDAPGVSLDFKVMIHKIHAGKHLPSVLGVSTNPDGSRNYGAPPTPYLGFSHVSFPAWPEGVVPLPRDQGYSALSSDDKAKEDEIRKGPSNCIVCHGDPDGPDGPLTAPAQGDLYMAQPSRQSCGSCHDDVLWGQNYTSNGQTMGAQANNANCTLCHATSGNAIAVFDAHVHPLNDPTFDTGVNVDITDLVESGANDGDGTIDPGEKIQITFNIVDDAGADIAPSDVSSPSVVVSGPTSNYNLLLNTTLPSAALDAPGPFTVNVPMQVQLERLGEATGGPDSFASEFTPHWNVAGALTTVIVRTGNGGGDSTLSDDTAAPQNYVDVDDASGFSRDDILVVDDGQPGEEYVKIQLVDGTRLWFSSPYSSSYKAGLSNAHSVGAAVRSVTTETKDEGVDYTLDEASGTVTEIGDFGTGNTVIASYTTDFVLPATYPVTLNDTPGLGDSTGEWTGKPLVDGTYSLGVWTSRSLTLNLYGESNSYKSTADAKKVDFLVGAATDIEPYALIASGSSCFNCHQELAFHGFGRRDFDSCVMCHGVAGAEDRPTYIAGNAPETPGVTVNFRSLLHKIHMGSNLANASTYDVVSHGSGAYPNNFSVANFGEVVFPAQPGGVENCAKCHGNDAWHEPAPRSHPTDQVDPVKRWTAVCASCHDTTDAQAHISVQTDALGNESCGVCHAPGKEWSVERMHHPY